MVSNHDDVAALKKELALPEDAENGVIYAGSELDGGPLKGITATYLPDGSKAKVTMRKLVEAKKEDFIK